MWFRRFCFPFLVVAGLGLSACNDQGTRAQVPVKASQSQKAAEAANSIVFTDNVEIDNIKARIELTSKPGALGFILLMNQAGQPIIYEGVKGKVTSGSKRLTKPFQVVGSWDCGEWNCDKELPSPSDEGTWGSSGEYIFYWNTQGEYRQWNGPYLYSDKPFRLRTEPLVINIQ